MINLIRSFSTAHSAFMRRQTVADITRALTTAQQELSTGLKADVYKSLGTGAAETLSLRATLDRDTAQMAANSLLGNRLDSTAETMGSIRDAVQDVLQIGLANKTGPLGTVSGLQTAARAALDSVIGLANSGHAGVPLFAGISTSNTPLQAWEQVNPRTGKSPAQVMDIMLRPGLDNPAEARAAVGKVGRVFSDRMARDVFNFEGTFYNGARTGSQRQAANIGDNTVLTYGAQANDQPFRDIMQGLSMLAATDPATIPDPEAYRIWIGEAVNTLAAGQTALLDSEVQIGTQGAQIESMNTRLQDRGDLYSGRVIQLEGIDSYEAATRISLLETQLQSSYAVSARLSQMSFLNYL